MLTETEYLRHDALGLAALVAAGEVTAAELAETAIARAERFNPGLNAINISMFDIARQRCAGELQGRFAGVPFLIKDITQDYAGVVSSAGCMPLKDWKASRTSTVVQRFLDAGLVVFGKTTTPELALKAVTESDAWGVTRNPWDTARTPGGSSGGAAAAVAAGIVPMAGANDGGGSIRIPAACCGLFGLKPSRGLVPSGPRAGEVWDGAATDLVVSRSVRDSAAALDALAGPDSGAPYATAPAATPYLDQVNRDPGPLRIALCTRSPLGTPVDERHVEAAVQTARLLESLGHTVVESQPGIDGELLATCYLRMYMGQVAADVADIRDWTGCSEDDFEPDTRAFAQAGRSLSAGEYVRSRRHWNTFARNLAEFFTRYDLYLTPTLASGPVRIGELDPPAPLRMGQRLALDLRSGGLLRRSGMIDRLAIESLTKTPFTQLANLAGTPAMSVPVPTTDGLPAGVQFVAPYGREDRLLGLAGVLEQAQPWFDRRPSGY